MDLDLTKRQKEIFDFIRRYAEKTGYPPTVREIGKAVGLHSSSTVHAHLANLEKIGLLRRDPSKPRAIELLIDKAKKTILPEQAGLPLLGHVAAGAPILAEENIEEYIEIPDLRGIPMRLNGVEPSRPVKGTSPSSLRVYQFRHSRSGTAILDVRRGRGLRGGRGRAAGASGLRASAGGGTLRTSVRTLALCLKRRRHGWTWI